MLKFNKILLVSMVICLLSVFLLGCVDSEDINKKSILTTVALDKKDDEIYIYVEIANIESGNKNGSTSKSADSKYIYIKSHGKTIIDARLNLNRQLDKEIYLSAIGTVVLTEDFAKEHLVEYLYRLRADELYRKKAATVITKDDPAELFKISNEKDLSVGFVTERMLKVLEEDGYSFSRTSSRLIENLSTKYTGFLMPCIGLQDKEISLTGYSVVNGSTIDGFIPAEGSEGIVNLKMNKTKFYYMVPYKENTFTIEVSLKKRKVKTHYKNGNISFDIKFDFDAKLMHGDKKTPYNFDDVANADATETLEEMIKKEISDAIKQAQEVFKCDYLQFDDEFRIKFPAEFEKMDWENEFSKASFNIDVNVELSGTWMMDYEINVRK